MAYSIRLFKLIAPASVAFICASSPAFAQSTGGVHVEIQGGLDHLAIPDQTGTAPGTNTGSSRAIYGIGAGYDVGLGGNLVAGIDSNLDFGGGSQCSSAVVIAADQLCGKLAHDWDIGARLGVKAGPALIYGRVAYDSTRVRTSYTDGAGNNLTSSTTANGVRLGAGVEYGLGGGVYVKGEYRYTPSNNLGSQQQVIGGIGVHF